MLIARQSTARTVTVGPVLDADGVAVTGGVVGDFKLSKNGGAPAALNGSATATHRHTGYYSLALTATDLDTVGQAEVVMDDTVNAMPIKELTVIEEVPYDALFAASAAGYGTAQTGDSFARLGAPAGASVSADIAAIEAQTDDIGVAGAGLTAVPWNAAWDAEVQSEVTDALNAYDPPTKAELDAADDAVLAILGTPAGASLSADVAAVKVDTAAILVDTGTTLDGKIDTIDTNVDAILVDTAEIGAAGAGLTAINLPNQTMDIVGNITGNLSGTVGSVTGAVGSVTGAVGSVTGNVGGNVTGTIGGLTAAALKDFFDTDSATTYASAVAGSVVKEIADNAGGSGLTEAGIADAVWDEVLAGHAGAGSAGEALEAAGTAGDPWTTALPGAYGSGTAGKIIGDNVNATISSRATQTSVDDLPTNAELTTALDAVPTAAENATQVRTELGTELARIDAAVSTRATPAQVNTEADTALADVGLTTTITGRVDAAVSTRASQTSVDDVPTNAELATALAAADDAVLSAIAALNNLSAAQVNAEIVDGLTVDVVADSVPADGSRPTIGQALYILTQFALERSVSGTTMTVNKPDGTTALLTLTLNDATSPTSITRAT